MSVDGSAPVRAEDEIVRSEPQDDVAKESTENRKVVKITNPTKCDIIKRLAKYAEQAEERTVDNCKNNSEIVKNDSVANDTFVTNNDASDVVDIVKTDDSPANANSDGAVRRSKRTVHPPDRLMVQQIAAEVMKLLVGDH